MQCYPGVAELSLLGKNISRSMAAPERWGCCSSMPHLQLAVCLKMPFQPAHKHRAHVYPIYIHVHIYTHGWSPRLTDRHAEHSHEHKQHQQAHPVTITGKSGWTSTTKNMYKYTNIFIHMYMVWIHIYSGALTLRHKSLSCHSPTPAAGTKHLMYTRAHTQRGTHTAVQNSPTH